MIEKYKSRRIRVAIRHVLVEKWNPIGVANEPMAHDEYDGYIGEIFGLLENGVSRKLLEEHLSAIESGAMGLNDVGEHPRRWEAVDELIRVFQAE